MGASQIHLVRHGEVYNPTRVLYGRIPGFHLSELGHTMAQAAADDLLARRRPVTRVLASPLQRAQESAEPIGKVFSLPVETEERIIEPTNHFEGKIVKDAMRDPRNWFAMRNPRRPSWGEAYLSISARMYAAIADAWASVDEGDVVLVSHQLPIWTVHRALAGKPLYHNPNQRRCHLSSITTLEYRRPPVEGEPPAFVEIGYADPAGPLLAEATDVGAV